MEEETTTVTVETPEETPEETSVVTDVGDTTVVVETPPSETSADGNVALIVGELVGRVESLEARLAETAVTAEIALDVADAAVEESVAAEEVAEDVGEAVVEVANAVTNDDPEELQETADVVEDHSDSILPTKKHFVHRSFRELMGRNA